MTAAVPTVYVLYTYTYFIRTGLLCSLSDRGGCGANAKQQWHGRHAHPHTGRWELIIIIIIIQRVRRNLCRRPVNDTTPAVIWRFSNGFSWSNGRNSSGGAGANMWWLPQIIVFLCKCSIAACCCNMHVVSPVPVSNLIQLPDVTVEKSVVRGNGNGSEKKYVNLRYRWRIPYIN